jgi:hypothetical protein
VHIRKGRMVRVVVLHVAAISGKETPFMYRNSLRARAPQFKSSQHDKSMRLDLHDPRTSTLPFFDNSLGNFGTG